jgi:glycosyltransferase involved in cell wall biosynthesis
MRRRLDLRRLASASVWREFKPDVIVSNDTVSLAVGTLASGLWRVPHVHTEHRQTESSQTLWRELLAGVGAPFLTKVILVDPSQRALWRRRWISKGRIDVIGNGVDAPVGPGRSEARSALGVDDRQVVTLMTATLRPEKRVADFIAAVRRAASAMPGMLGVIAGGGEQLGLARTLTLGDPCFRVLGEQHDIDRLLLGADLFVLPSEMEAQPMAILEAMAAGLPIVATRVGGVPNLVRQGQNGVLVDVGDVIELGRAIADLAADAQRRARYGQSSRQLWEKHWTADLMVDHYESALRALVRSRSSPKDP